MCWAAPFRQVRPPGGTGTRSLRHFSIAPIPHNPLISLSKCIGAAKRKGPPGIAVDTFLLLAQCQNMTHGHITPIVGYAGQAHQENTEAEDELLNNHCCRS